MINRQNEAEVTLEKRREIESKVFEIRNKLMPKLWDKDRNLDFAVGAACKLLVKSNLCCDKPELIAAASLIFAKEKNFMQIDEESLFRQIKITTADITPLIKFLEGHLKELQTETDLLKWDFYNSGLFMKEGNPVIEFNIQSEWPPPKAAYLQMYNDGTVKIIIRMQNKGFRREEIKIPEEKARQITKELLNIGFLDLKLESHELVRDDDRILLGFNYNGKSNYIGEDRSCLENLPKKLQDIIEYLNSLIKLK